MVLLSVYELRACAKMTRMAERTKTEWNNSACSDEQFVSRNQTERTWTTTVWLPMQISLVKAAEFHSVEIGWH